MPADAPSREASSRDRELAYQAPRPGYRLLLGLGAHRHTLDADDFHIRHAHEGQYRLHVGDGVVERCRRTFRIDATRSDNQIDFLVLDQSFRTALGIAEGE